jgi:hypothetical protein
VSRSRSPLGRAFKELQAAFERFLGLRSALKLAGIAAVLLIGGTLAPWEVEHEGISYSAGWIAGSDFNVGLLTLIIAAIAIVLIARGIRSGHSVDSAGLAALGLAAVVLVGINGIRIHDGSASIGWGLYVSAAGAVGLLLGGLILLGEQQEPLGPPD